MQKRKRVLGAVIGTMLGLSLLFSPNAELSPVYGADAPVAIDETNFPDAVFREYVKENFDKDGNDELSVSEMERVTTIYVTHKNVADLTGIEYFNNLENLDCGYNQLSNLDVSQNIALTQLICANNQLSNLDVSQNAALETLDCSANQLSSLDVSRNIALTQLGCNYNQLSNLDVSQNIALETLSCHSNQLSNLDVSQNVALYWFDCQNNQLSNLDVSQNIALTVFNCQNTQLSNLDVSQNTALRQLICSNNQLSSLDVSQNTDLEDLECYNQEISLPHYQVGSQCYIDLSPLHLDTGRVSLLSSGTYDSATGHIEWLEFQSFAETGGILTYQYDVGYQNQTMEVTIISMEVITSSPSTEVTEQDMSQSTNTTATGQDTPKTGDTMLPVWIAILGLFSTVSYLVARKKK